MAVPPSIWAARNPTTNWSSAAAPPGSDVTIGGDSGISLVDPSDSGLSLETPVNLGTVPDKSLDLDDSDMLAVSETATEGTLSAR